MSVEATNIKIKEIITIFKGKPPAVIPYYGKDALSYLSPEFLRGKELAVLAKPSSNGILVNDGDIVILWDGSNAGELFSARRGLLASTMALVEHSNNFDRQYFFYGLKRWESYLKGQTSGSGIPHVDKEVLGNLKILLLTRAEQTQIATILSTIDRAIEQTEALIAKQQRIKTGLMQDLLTKGIDENGNIRSEETHKFKDSPLGRIPVEWEVKRLGETLEDITYGLTVRPKYVEEGIPLISAKECGNGSIDYESCNKIMQQDFKRLRERSLPKYGDVLITKTGTLGRVARINQSDPYSAITQNVALLRPNIKIIRPEFLEIILNSEKIQKDIKDGVTVLSIPDIQLGVLAKFEFPIPSLNEQDKLIRQIEKFDADTLLNKKYLSKIKLLKTGLMQDLLTGKVRVTDLLNQKTATN